MHGANFHTVYMAAEILLVECKPCGRRSALTRAEAPIFEGNMTELRAVPFKCERCGAKLVRLYIPASDDEATMWLAGDPLPDGREARNDRDPT